MACMLVPVALPRVAIGVGDAIEERVWRSRIFSVALSLSLLSTTKLEQVLAAGKR